MPEISGTITRSGAVALAGVTIELFRGGATLATTTPAADGTYAFTGLADDAYVVQPTLIGYRFSPSSTVIDSLQFDRKTVSFRGENITISGQVLALPKFEPVAGAAVVITGKLLGGKATDQQVADSRGRYAFDSVKAGESYKLIASADGYITSTPLDIPNLDGSRVADLMVGKTPSDLKLFDVMIGVFGLLGGSAAALLYKWLMDRCGQAAVEQDSETELESLVENTRIEAADVAELAGDPNELPAAVGQNVGELSEESMDELTAAVGRQADTAEVAEQVANLKGLANDPQAFTAALNDIDPELYGDVVRACVSDTETFGENFGKSLQGFLQESGALAEDSIPEAVGSGIDATSSFDTMLEAATDLAETGEGFVIDTTTEAFAETIGAEAAPELADLLVVLLDLLLAAAA